VYRFGRIAPHRGTISAQAQVRITKAGTFRLTTVSTLAKTKSYI
jgi:hypothetical protein